MLPFLTIKILYVSSDISILGILQTLDVCSSIKYGYFFLTKESETLFMGVLCVLVVTQFCARGFFDVSHQLVNIHIWRASLHRFGKCRQRRSCCIEKIAWSFFFFTFSTSVNKTLSSPTMVIACKINLVSNTDNQAQPPCTNSCVFDNHEFMPVQIQALHKNLINKLCRLPVVCK